MGPLKGDPWRHEGETTGRMLVRNFGQIALSLPKCVPDPEIRKVVLDASKVAIMLLFIIANAFLFAHVLTTERIPHHIAEAIVGWGLPAWGFLIIVNILLLMAGNFMEPSAILLIMAPILFPIAIQLGIDPDPSWDHHGGQHGNRDDHATGWAQSIRARGNNRARHRLGGESSLAVAVRAPVLPGVDNVYPADIAVPPGTDRSSQGIQLVSGIPRGLPIN